MKKGFLFVTIFCLAVYGSFGMADLSEAKDKLSPHDRQIMEEFKHSFKNSAEGRFETVKVDDKSILIIDTKLGHLWVLHMSPEALIKYAGKVYPGRSFWKTIYRAK
jgi:hypothetical protein